MHEIFFDRLVFSQSLLSLDLIEEMLAVSTALAVDESDTPSMVQKPCIGPHQVWKKNIDYYRMDGSSASKYRQKWIDEFNDESDRRFALFQHLD